MEKRTWSRSTQEFVDLHKAWGSSHVEVGFTVMSVSKPAHQKHPKKDVLELPFLSWVLLLGAELWHLWDSWSGNPSVSRNVFCSLRSRRKSQIWEHSSYQARNCSRWCLSAREAVPWYSQESMSYRVKELVNRDSQLLHLTWFTRLTQWLFNAKQPWYDLAQYVLSFWTVSILSWLPLTSQILHLWLAT